MDNVSLVLWDWRVGGELLTGMELRDEVRSRLSFWLFGICVHVHAWCLNEPFAFEMKGLHCGIRLLLCFGGVRNAWLVVRGRLAYSDVMQNVNVTADLPKRGREEESLESPGEGAQTTGSWREEEGGDAMLCRQSQN